MFCEVGADSVLSVERREHGFLDRWMRNRLRKDGDNSKLETRFVKVIEKRRDRNFPFFRYNEICVNKV